MISLKSYLSPIILSGFLLFPFFLSAQLNGTFSRVSDQVKIRMDSDREVPVIIYLKQAPALRTQTNASKTEKAEYVHSYLNDHATESQKRIISWLKNRQTGYKSYSIVNALSASLSKEQILQLAQFDEVLEIACDSPVRMESFEETAHFLDSDPEPEWGIRVIQADKVWEKDITGSGVVIGGQDTGYDWMHPAITKKYRGWREDGTADHRYNWHDAIHDISPLHNDSIPLPSNNPCGLDVKFPCDDGSHGTHTMGTMVGSDSDNLIGVAPDAHWIGCRNMERGYGKPSTYIECFEWFLAPTDLDGLNPDPALAPHVINNSWYCPALEGCDPSNWHFMEAAVQNLREAGVFVVVSAGNSGNACGRINAPPAMFAKSFAVGATYLKDTTQGAFIDEIASYSSWGPVTIDGSNRLKPDISAPGSRVRSSVPPDRYASYSGTSMAGPHVAGVVALIISANPDLAGKVDEIEEILQLSADPMFRQDTCGNYIATEHPNFVYGYGRVNALEAVNLALNLLDSSELPKSGFNLTLAPNPAEKTLRISWDSEKAGANVKITDTKGVTYSVMNISNNQRIDVSHLPSGIYILKTNLDGYILSKPFVKL